jgi:16S rRNA (guanine527-N7)-methyltransferase
VDTAVIRRLLEPFADLDEQRLFLISKYIDLLLKWNARINLTAVRVPEEMVQRHFGESLFAARRLLSGGMAQHAVDVGSGAGFPGVPIALLAPSLRVTLVESSQKKATFLRELIRTLDLKNVEVFNDRAERYAHVADLVTMRAVETFDKALGVAARLVQSRGRIALMIGSTQVLEARGLLPTMEWEEPIAVPGGHSRILLVGTKVVKVE